MKKLISFFLAALMCISAGMAISATESITTDSKALRFAVGTNIIQVDDNMLTQPVTRGEFCEFLTRVCYLKADHPISNRYTDLSGLTDESITAVGIITDLGYMVGTGAETFEPQRNITKAEAVKTFAVIMGYDSMVKTNNPTLSDYIKVAYKMKIADNISADNTPCDYNTLAQLVYNCKNKNVLTATKATNESVIYTEGDTFLKEIMKLDETEGRLTDNGITSLSGKSRVLKNQIIVDDKILNLSEEADYVKSYIGRKIVCYCRIEKDDFSSFPVVYAYPKDNYDEVSFTFEQYEEFTGSGFYYTGEKDKREWVDIAKTPYIIYNGIAVSELKPEYLDYEFGNITVLSSEKGENDIILIEAYYSAYVTDVDVDKDIVYLSKKNAYIPDNVYVLDKTDLQNVSVFGSDGAVKSIDEITPYSVIDICKSENFTKIIIPADSYVSNIKLTAIGEEIYSSDTQDYKISEKFMNSADFIAPKAGESCNFFINSFGYVVWIDKSEGKSEYAVGCMLGVNRAPASSFQTAQVKMMTEDGKVLVLDTAEKVRLRDENGNTNNYNKEALSSFLENVFGLVEYDLNEDNKISFIGMPLVKGELYSAIKTIYDHDSGELPYGYNVFGGKVVATNKTKVFYLSKDFSEPEDRYTTGSVSDFIVNKQYEISAYSFEKNSPLADYIVIYNNTALDLVKHDCFIVTKITSSMNENGDEIKKLYGYKAIAVSQRQPIQETVLSAKESVVTNISDVTASGNTYNVQAGDIIRYNLRGDEIKKAELLYRYDMDNVINASGRRGGIPGSIGKFVAGAKGSNPFIYGSTSSALNFNSGEHRYALGYVLNADEQGNITYTTQDLSLESYNPENSEYITESILNPLQFVAVNSEGNKYKVTDGNLNDVRAYNDCGENCSRILVKYSYGLVTNIFVLN